MIEDWLNHVSYITMGSATYYPEYYVVRIHSRRFGLSMIEFFVDGPDQDLIDFFNEPLHLIYPGISQYVQSNVIYR